jgi:hypothetical protein
LLAGSLRRSAAVAAMLAIVIGWGARMAVAAPPLHPTIRLRAQWVGFYAGHLVLDGRGAATLDDGVLHVRADRIIVDMRAERYIAAGSVEVMGVNAAQGDALGVDLTTHRGVLVDTTATRSSELVADGVIGGPVTIGAGDEPLALPDVGFEQPYIRASEAVAHLGADVRMTNAHIIVPGGESVGLPSFVYTFSTDPGYSTNNVPTSGEDVPIYFGSSPLSVQGIHFSYNPVTKVGVGLNSNFVYGSKAYVLLAAAPLYGPGRAFNFTWQDHINDRASQTFNSFTESGVGTNDSYQLRDSIHRSYLELTAAQGLGAHQATLAWQSFNQYFGGGDNRPYFYLRSEFGYDHVPVQTPFLPFPSTAVLPRTVWHNAFEGYLASPTFDIGPYVNLFANADLRDETDSLPHRQVSQQYTLTLYTRLNRKISLNYSDSIGPVLDVYPSVNAIFHSTVVVQTLFMTYDNNDPFRLSLTLSRATVASDNPIAPVEAPWQLGGDLRFRVTRSLSLDLSRQYLFGFEGQRFSSLGLQILP